MRLTQSVVLLAMCGCFSPTMEGGPIVLGAYRDGGSVDGVRCQRFERLGATICAVIPQREVCAGVECAQGELCCLTTGRCVDRDAPCPVLPTTWPNFPGAVACSTSAQCGEGLVCMPDDLSCGGASHCQSPEWCSTCLGEAGVCAVCGCNGVTYATDQEACVAGVNIIGRGACGQGPCVFDSQCTAGSFCCPSSSACVPTAEAWRCGQGLNCLRNSECMTSGQGGGPGAPATVFCRHAGCEDSRGVCSFVAAKDCGGEEATVCGCDGVTYVNECWAHVAGTNVVSMGVCP